MMRPPRPKASAMKVRAASWIDIDKYTIRLRVTAMTEAKPKSIRTNPPSSLSAKSVARECF